MSNTSIRQAVSTDLPTLLSIDKASFPAGIAYNSSELSYFMGRTGAATLVAELNDRIVGFILVEIRPRRMSATLVTLDVLESHRRQGIATELLAASEKLFRDQTIERYELQVDVGNSGAMSFYGKHGFAVVHLLPKYYANGNDAYLMVKRFTKS